ncbi:uncharacterized protein WM277_024378 isoform 1-T1 [Molossus nigricans]
MEIFLVNEFLCCFLSPAQWTLHTHILLRLTRHPAGAQWSSQRQDWSDSGYHSISRSHCFHYVFLLRSQLRALWGFHCREGPPPFPRALGRSKMTTILCGCNAAKALSTFHILSIFTQFQFSPPSFCQGPRLLSFRGYYKQSCYEHWCTSLWTYGFIPLAKMPRDRHLIIRRLGTGT